MKLVVPGPEPEILDLTPLIDIIFQLIIFFLLAGSFVTERGREISVPQADATQIVTMDEALTVAITSDGSLYVPADAENPSTMSQLIRKSSDYRKKRDEAKLKALVVIQADKDAPFDRVIHAWNAIRNSGIASVTFQLSPGSPSAP